MNSMRIFKRMSLAVALMAYVGCANVVDRKTERVTQGALRAAGEKVQQIDPGAIEPLTEAGARAVVSAVLAQLNSPAQQRQLAEVVTVMTAAASRGIAGADLDVTAGAMADLVASRTLAVLTRELAVDAPLRHGMNDATRELAGSVVAGARDELTIWWGCTGRDSRHCIERRLIALTRELTRGATEGVLETLAVGLLALSFIAGVLVSVVVVVVVLVVRRQPPRFRRQATSSVTPPITAA